MKPNTKRNNRIVRMVEIEGRTFTWIAKKEGISETMVRKVYGREKYKQQLQARELSKTAPIGGEARD